MLKRIITMSVLSVLVFSMASFQFASISFANNQNSHSLIAVEAETFFHVSKDTEGKVGLVKTIAEKTGGDWQAVLAGIIKLVLSITGAIALTSFTYAGVMFVTARGNEDQLTKAKHMIFWSLLALAIIATSYAIVLGVSQLQF